MMSRDASNSIPQACAVPYRVAAGQIEVCVVTSMKKRRWTFPKGIVEPGETPSQAALKEAWEEAGVRGAISGPTLGSYERMKWGQPLQVACYLLHVEREYRAWPESGLRKRTWVPLDEVADVISCRGQREVLLAATARLKRRLQAG
jgi:phosphohistidine phosphatase